MLRPVLYDNSIVDESLTDEKMADIVQEYHDELHMLGNAVSAKYRHEQSAESSSDFNLEQFAKRFLTGRINWWNVPKVNAVTDFGTIISLVLYRKGQVQVELFISHKNNGQFPSHRHPDVDTYEFPLSGNNILYMNGKPLYTDDEILQWLNGDIKVAPVHISPNDWHSGVGYSSYAFLSIQHWLNGVTPTSVGMNWIGEPSSDEQVALWKDMA